jgi:hypothetical protein
MNPWERFVEHELEVTRMTAVQLFNLEVLKAMDETPKHGRAHTVNRVTMIFKGDKKVPYRTILHYAPEIGYWGCVKDNHNTLKLVTDSYCLASTVRELMGEYLFSINRGEVNE